MNNNDVSSKPVTRICPIDVRDILGLSGIPFAWVDTEIEFWLQLSVPCAEAAGARFVHVDGIAFPAEPDLVEAVNRTIEEMAWFDDNVGMTAQFD